MFLANVRFSTDFFDISSRHFKVVILSAPSYLVDTLFIYPLKIIPVSFLYPASIEIPDFTFSLFMVVSDKL